MPLESAVYIDTLDATNPTGDDPVAEADDHIRQVKQTLKTTFPNIKGVVAPSHDDLNKRLVPKPAAAGGMFIAMWSGIVATIPAEWQLCDGTNGTPDLRDVFIVGAGRDYAVGAKGGTNTATVSTNPAATLASTSTGSHSHSGNTQAHVLTIAEIPPHTHSIDAHARDGSAAVLGDGGSQTTYVGVKTGSTGGGLGHTHGINADGVHTHDTTIPEHNHTVDTRSPYYALCFIAKV